MKKLTKLDKKILKDLNKAIKVVNEADAKAHSFLKEGVYEDHAANLFANGQDALVNAFLKVCCGEESDIWDLCDEFSTPGNPEKGKPVCWNGSFPPETIQAIIAYGTYSLKDKIKIVRAEYQLCLDARENFNG